MNVASIRRAEYKIKPDVIEPAHSKTHKKKAANKILNRDTSVRYLKENHQMNVNVKETATTMRKLFDPLDHRLQSVLNIPYQFLACFKFQ